MNTTGKITIKDKTGSTVSASQIGNAYTYTGRQLDEETKLYYYRARHYSPTLRRFVQRDPLGYVDGPNALTYTTNQPTKLLDPLGLDPPGHWTPPEGTGGGGSYRGPEPEDPDERGTPGTGQPRRRIGPDNPPGPKGRQRIIYAYDMVEQFGYRTETTSEEHWRYLRSLQYYLDWLKSKWPWEFGDAPMPSPWPTNPDGTPREDPPPSCGPPGMLPGTGGC